MDKKKECNEYWINLWSPKSFSDIYVAKNAKLNLKTWLEEVCSSSSGKAPMLLLVGPTGSGKTALVNCTCDLLKIAVSRWEIALDVEYSDATAAYYESQVKKFEHFLVTSARYRSVFEGDAENKTVIVVEDFPHAFFQNPEKLHKIIKNHSMFSSTPVIFTCDENAEQKLFPHSFLFELKLKQLKIKQMSPSAVFLVLNRVKTLFPKVVNVSTEYLKKLSKEANGDCRSALLTLYCHVFGVKRDEIKPTNILPYIRKKTKQSKISTEKKPKQNLRDNDLGIFHLLGQMLYPKLKPIEGSASEVSMFEHDPNEIAQAAQSYPNIILLAHENYLSTFGDINDASVAATHLSEVDVLNQEMLDRDNLQKIAFSVMSFGLMLTNKHVIRKWNPWRKSKHYDTISANEKLKNKLEAEVPEYCIHTRTLLMELIPIVRSCNLDSKILQMVPNFGERNISKTS